MKNSPSVNIAVMGLLLAVMIILTMLEHMLPPLPFLPPHMKPGLANVITMYAVFFMKPSQAVTLNVLKSLFVLLVRGPTAGLLSFSGGMLSIFLIILLVYLLKDKISYALVSVAGACAHNLGQYAALSLFMASVYWVYYLPVLLIAGVVMGLLTGAVLKIVLPVLDRVMKGLNTVS
jgi:heptaprenyl diphosphate synthase